jgi:hypothetical protein
LGQHLFMSIKSVHIHHLPFFFLTITMFASHWGYATSLIKPASSSLCTSAFAVSTFSSDILRSFCFLGFAHGLTCNWCSMMSLLTPNKSEVDHTKTSLFLLRKTRSFACSCWVASTPMHTALSGALGSKGTFLNSPSALMCYARASALQGRQRCCVALVLLTENVHFCGLTRTPSRCFWLLADCQRLILY